MNDGSIGINSKLSLESILTPEAGIAAFTKVKSNNGAPGVDQVSVDDIAPIFPARWEMLCKTICTGNYRPQALRRVEIPKTSGGTRKLGIPAVMDRVVQQVLAQALTPLFEPRFSDSSFAYRPGKHAFAAIDYVQRLLNEHEFNTILHLDIQNFFDSVSHVVLRTLLERKSIAPDVLDLIDQTLNCGVFENRLVRQTPLGVPQGSPLSPLLANIILHELDLWLSNRHFAFARYADDVVILLPSIAMGRQLIEDASVFLNRNLELSLNREKTLLARWDQGEFLGFGFQRGNDGLAVRCVSRKSHDRCREEIDRLTEPFSRSIAEIEKELAAFLSGWLAYYRHTEIQDDIRGIYSHARDRIRQLRWAVRATREVRYSWLIRLGISPERAEKFTNAQQIEFPCEFDKKLLGVLREAMPDKSFQDCALAEDMTLHRKKTNTRPRSEHVDYSGHVRPPKGKPRISWWSTASCWLHALTHSRFIRFRLETRRRPNSIFPRPDAIGVFIGSFYFKIRL